MNSPQPWDHLISIQGVVDFRAEGIRRYGGAMMTKPPEDCIDASLGAAWSAGLYREPEESKPGLCFAAHVLYYISRNHCFTEGNKRAAWLSTMEILARLGLTVRATVEEAFTMMEDVIKGGIPDADGVIFWMESRLEVLSFSPLASSVPPQPS